MAGRTPPRGAKPPALRVRSTLVVETPRGAFTGKRWMELLAAIDHAPSITAAAKAVGLSYKAAWDAVEAMNNLADAPLVVRTKGGRGGGGAQLTPQGRVLVASFAAAQLQNDQFVASLNTGAADAAAGLKLLGRLALRTSARNHLAGTVTRVVQGAVNAQVELKLGGGGVIVAIITLESLARLALAPGTPVIALVKASSVMVAAGTRPLRLSARNQLAGKVARLVPGAVNAEVVIDIGGGKTLAAVVTVEALEALGLAAGKPALALFKASSVILALAD